LLYAVVTGAASTRIGATRRPSTGSANAPE
jgi:hypothetical protein